MLIDKAAVINWSLNDIGHFSNYTTFDEDAQRDVELAWQRCYDRCLALHDWNDFRKTFKLVRSADAPDNGWAYEFELPGGRVGEPLKILQQAGQSEVLLRHFDREGNYVYANVEAVWARCKVYKDPQYWDPGWRDAFTVALSGFLAAAIYQNTDLKAELHKTAFGTPSKEGAGGLFGRLMGLNRAGAPVGSPPLQDDPLTNAHTGPTSGPWHGRY